MSTMCASGRSQRESTIPAVTEAIEEAMTKLRAARVKPRVGFLFAGSRHALEGALITAREMTGGADILGCTTAGEITERGSTRNGIAVLLLAGDDLVLDAAAAGGMRGGHDRAADALCARFVDTANAARNAGRVASTTVALVDGLAGTGEKLIASIMKNTRSFQQVVGGAAGDDGR